MLVLCIRSPGGPQRFLINAILALSAFATLHARMLSLAKAGFMGTRSLRLGHPRGESRPARGSLDPVRRASSAGVVALVIGLPVLRLTDVYLAICTLGFGEVVRILVVLLPGLTGGPTGANLSTASRMMPCTGPAPP